LHSLLKTALRAFLLAFVISYAALSQAIQPGIQAQDIDGKPRDVNAYIGQGKWTVVVFWAHDCPICNRDIQEMTFFQDAHEDTDATVLGISMDGFANADKARAFIERHELNFPNLLIKQNQAEFMKFGGGRFIGTPSFYIYSPTGELMAINVGPLSTDIIDKFIQEQTEKARKKT